MRSNEKTQKILRSWRRAVVLCCVPFTLLACQEKPAGTDKASGPGAPPAADTMGTSPMTAMAAMGLPSKATSPKGVSPKAGSRVANATLKMVGRYKSKTLGGAETLHIQRGGSIAVLCDSKKGAVEVVDIAVPTKVKFLANHDLKLIPGEEATSAAIHPTYGYYLVAIQSAGVHRRGRIEIRSVASGKLMATIPSGVGPDAVAISNDGNLASVSNEGEPFSYDPKRKIFETAAGSVTLIHLYAEPRKCAAVEFHLPSYAANLKRSGRDALDRMLDRKVDWNGNGKIDKKVDFNGNGKIEDVAVVVGSYRGVPIKANESRGEVFLFPARLIVSGILEPEYAAFSPSGHKLYLVVQEANLIAVIDTRKMAVERYFDLGVTTHRADTVADGKFQLDAKPLTFFREPDGLSISPSGRYLVTSDEGDSVPPITGAPRTNTHGGGRTLSVFDVATGKVLGDTGDQIDVQAAKVGAYPDERSGIKGSEPEEVSTFVYGGVLYAVVSLERADGVALVSLLDPTHPKVLGVASMHKGVRGTYQPEGIATWRHPKEDAVYVFTADAETGTMTVFRVAGPSK